MSQSQQDCLITVTWLKKKNYKNRFFRVVFSGLVCMYLSPINLFMALFLNQNLWGLVRNEYVRLLVQELLRISKRQQQSQTPSSCTCRHAMVWWKEFDQTAPPGSRLHHLVPVIQGESQTPRNSLSSPETGGRSSLPLSSLPGLFFKVANVNTIA